MNGKKINNALIQRLLELADWAPTHGRTEPWRFVVYEQDAVRQFCRDHAELYKAATEAEKFTNAKFEKLQQQGDLLSHIIVVYMKRSVQNSISVLEEIAAVSAAMQNILLGAKSLGIAALWSTGGMTHDTSMKKYLELGEEDIVIGLLYLGYTDTPEKEGQRRIPLEEKVSWHA